MQSVPTSPLYQVPILRPKVQTLLSNNRAFPATHFHRPKMTSVSELMAKSQMASVGSSSEGDNGFCTLIEYVGKKGINVEDDLVVLLNHIQYACKRIAALVASPFNNSLGKQGPEVLASGGSDRDAPKPLDIVSVDFLRN